MVTLERIESSLFTKLYESFLIDDDPLSDEQDWRNVFDYRWDTEEGHCGYALLDDGQVVGMMGMVFSERYIDGAIKKFCNLHTWWVREDYRGRSLLLLRPILNLDGYTITHFTPCDTVRAVTKRLGFKRLSTQLRVLLPQFLTRTSEEATLTYDEQTIEPKLIEYDKTIFLNHQPYGCGHLLVNHGDEYCYVLYTFVVRHWLPYCHIHYISNRAIFEKTQPVIRSSLIRKHNAKFVGLDARRVSDMSFPSSFKFWAPGDGLYKSADMKPEQIDNLYSDVVMLKLSVLPSARSQLARFAGRLSSARLLRAERRRT